MNSPTPLSDAVQLEALRKASELNQQIISSAQEGIIVYDRELRYMLWNRSMEEMSGVPSNEVLGKHPLEVFPELRGQPLYDQLERALAGETLPAFDIRYRVRGTGKSGWASVKQAPLFDADGGITGVVATAREITERKLAEDMLRKSEQKFSTIFQTIPDSVAITRAKDGLILDVNDAFAERGGWLKSELIGKSSLDLDIYVEPDVRQRQMEMLRETGEFHNVEARYRVKDGSVGVGLMSAKTLELDGEQCVVSITKEITDLKLAEEAVRQSEAKFRALAETTPSAIVMYQDDKIRYVNPAMEVITGYSRQELLEMILWDLLPPDSRKIIEGRREARQKGEPVSARNELKFVTKSGEERWVDYATGLIDFEGKPATIGTAFDITARKQAEEALRESEEKFRALVDHSIQGIVLYQEERIAYVNAAYSKITGFSYEESLAQTMTQRFELVHPDDRARIIERQARFQRGEPIDEVDEVRIMRGDGEMRWVIASTRSFAIQGKPARLGMMVDITERKRADEELRNSHEQLRALSAHLQSVREEERTMIAREIHDELGQALTALKMDLSALQNGLNKKGAAQAERLIQKTKSMSNLIDTTIQTVRRIATELRPGILDDLGLVAAIEWQAQEFQNRTGIDCRFTSRAEDLELDRDRSTAAFRIFQETLTNVARHAEATSVEVSLNHQDHKLVLEIRDNGRGISEANIAGSRSLGLLGMRERAQLLGGELKISGPAGKGTTVTVWIPVE